MRLLRFRRALRDFFRRWGLSLLVAAAVFGAGSDAPLIAAAAASLLQLPLRSVRGGRSCWRPRSPAPSSSWPHAREETAHHAARWILILAVAIAFGSEVAAS